MKRVRTHHNTLWCEVDIQPKTGLSKLTGGFNNWAWLRSGEVDFDNNAAFVNTNGNSANNGNNVTNTNAVRPALHVVQ